MWLNDDFLGKCIIHALILLTCLLIHLSTPLHDVYKQNSIGQSYCFVLLNLFRENRTVLPVFGKTCFRKRKTWENLLSIATFEIKFPSVYFFYIFRDLVASIYFTWVLGLELATVYNRTPETTCVP